MMADEETKEQEEKEKVDKIGRYRGNQYRLGGSHVVEPEKPKDAEKPKKPKKEGNE